MERYFYLCMGLRWFQLCCEVKNAGTSVDLNPFKSLKYTKEKRKLGENRLEGKINRKEKRTQSDAVKEENRNEEGYNERISKKNDKDRNILNSAVYSITIHERNS